MNATQLGQLQIDYQYIEDRFKMMSLAIETTKTGWSDKLHQIKNMESLVRDLERFKDAASALQKSKRELAWSLVREKEMSSASLANRLNDQSMHIVNLDNEIGKLSETISEIVEKKHLFVQEQSSAREAESSAK